MIRQAIVTKYSGPTNTKGSRVYARADAGSAVHAWDHSLNVEQNHEAARKKLCEKLAWFEAKWRTGSLPNNKGYVHVMETK